MKILITGGIGKPLNTARTVAKIVKKLIPSADLKIGTEMAPADVAETRFRGILSIDNAREQLGYEPRYADLEEGTAEYIDTYRRYLRHTGALVTSAGLV